MDVGELNLNHVNEFVSASQLSQSRNDKIPSNSIKGFDTSIMSQVIERVCKIVLFFLIAADCFSPVIVSNLFYSWFLIIAVFGSVAWDIVFITFFIYDRYDSCSRSNTHGAKLPQKSWTSKRAGASSLKKRL